MRKLGQDELDHIAGLPDLSDMQRLAIIERRAIETAEEWDALVRHLGLVETARTVLESEGYLVTPPFMQDEQAVLQAEQLLVAKGWGVIDAQAAKRWSLAWLVGWRLWLEVRVGPLAATDWRVHWDGMHWGTLTRYADLRWWRLRLSISARRWNCSPWQPHSMAPLMTQSLVMLCGGRTVISL